MCGRASRIFFFLFWGLFFLSSSFLSAQQEASSPGSEGYWVTEEELTQLENILDEQESLLKMQEEELKRAKNQLELGQSQLKEALNSINSLSLSINRAETSLKRLENEMRLRTAGNWVLGIATGTFVLLWLFK